MADGSSEAGRGGATVLAFDDVRFEVGPQGGGRITAFCLGGVNVLGGLDVHPTHYGSTLWTSPQSDWGWPPPAEFDDRPFTVDRKGEAIVLTGPPCAALGVRLTKRFSIDRVRRAIALRYAIENIGQAPKTYAPWEVSRVRAAGLTFFPTGLWHAGPLPVVRAGGCTWYAHDPKSLDDVGQKHVADGSLGYVAHVAGDILFVKSFVDLPHHAQAPGEGEVEIYGNNRYVEVEAQGPYATIAPGASACWDVRWHLRALPKAMSAHAGNTDLMALASALAG